ncbi:MAG: beta/gamma crystallin-related protein [Pseudomonadota bacterium]
MQRMHFFFALSLVCAGLFLSPKAEADRRGGFHGGGAEIILYSDTNFRGEARVYRGDIDSLRYDGFNNVARSVEIRGGAWTLCEHSGFDGRCRTIDYSIPHLGDIGLDCKLTSFYRAGYSSGQGYGGGYQGGYGQGAYPVTLFTRDDFRGNAVGIQGPTNLRDIGFNNKPDSIIVDQGRWIICTKSDLRGRCEVIGRSVRNLDRIDLGEKISSIAPYQGRRY